jgi:hypothetical protein
VTDRPEWERPHFVYPALAAQGDATLHANYKAAFEHWRAVSTYQKPYMVAVMGRTIDPGTPIVDVNE